MRTWLRRTNKRDYMTVLSDSFYPQKCLLRLTPLHREPFGILPKKAGLQTFLHSQAPSHPNGQWRLCLGAITEFTAAGQSEIHTPVPN